MSRLLIVLCLCLSALGAPSRKKANSNDGKIVGGTNTDIHMIPYQVSLQYKNGHFCGGSIISARYILTAAHCLESGFNTKDLSVRVGSSLKNTGGEVYRVKKTIIHPKYDTVETDSDLALIELETFIKASSGAKIISLSKTEPKSGEAILVSGWGKTKDGGATSRTLKSVTLPVINRQLCQRMFLRFNSVTERMFCAGYPEGGKDACQGDSGGPAVAKSGLVGVVSWGSGCAKRNSPGVYAKVAKFLPWIEKITGVKAK